MDIMIPRHISQNLLHHLRDRENGYIRQYFIHCVPPSHEYFERETIKCITPNLTIQNVDKPLGFIRKFAPDGRLLISFSHNQRCLEIFEYKGVHAVSSLLKSIKTECILSSDFSPECLTIRQKVFERMFHSKKTICVEPGIPSCLLNREFSIFMENGRYVLVAATIHCDGGLIPASTDLQSFVDLYDDCELLSYFFYLIDLQSLSVKDRFVYQNDCIILSHNNGVSVHGSIIAVLSKYRQNIDLFELAQGKIVKLTSIGDFRDDLDATFFMKFPQSSATTVSMTGNKFPLTFLKQRIMAYLYRRIVNIEMDQVTQRGELQKFYKDYGILERMLLSKIQLINEDNILIRYEEREGEAIAGDKQQTGFKLYVFFCISEGTILKVFPKDSVELLYLFRDFCDCFRNVRSMHTQRPPSSPSNNIFLRESFNNAVTTTPGGPNGAALRINATLPISTQSFTTTQYMDFNIFDYDDNFISALERPKISTLEPINFRDRNTNITKFRLFLDSPGLRFDNNGNHMISANCGRELVAFLFHPYEPFLISIQKISTHYIVNFHIYNGTTIVQK